MIHASNPVGLSETLEPGPGRFQTAEAHAFEYLRKQILAGNIAAGEKLYQDELATLLGLSRMPVRQALLRLENDGLVTYRPNRGAVVTQLSADAILELFEIRSVLEALAFSLAIPRIDERGLAEVERRVRALPQRETDPSSWIQMHDELHDFLCTFANRPRLRAQLTNLRQSVVPYLRLFLSTNQRAEMQGHEHEALLVQIRCGDIALAEKTMREHVMSAAQDVVDFVRDQNENKRPK